MDDIGEYIKDSKIYAAFVAWLQEPDEEGGMNINHLNTRTQDCCEVAFKAGYDAAKQGV